MTHFLASDENQSDRDSEMDALLHAIQRDTAGQVQDYFSPQVAQTEKMLAGRQPRAVNLRRALLNNR